MKLPVDYTKLSQSQRRFVRQLYIRRQDGLCQHCNKPLNGLPSEKVNKLSINKKLFPISFFKHPIHLHHCHTTGKTIGAVHNKCNAVLWQYHGE